MNYAKIKHYDIANGEGVRMSLFVSGCKFHCKDCFNEETWDYCYGSEYTDNVHDELLSLVSKENISGLSILGGDPLWQNDDGLKSLIKLVDDVKSINKNVWIWSGFEWEYIFSNGTELQKELILKCDVFVDGRFDNSKRDIKLKWRGSTNQRVIDVAKTISSGNIITIE